MKKKVLVTAAVCALSVACVFGATACNKSGDSSGVPDVGDSVQVTEEQWNAAIERSSTSTNYTASSFAKATETIYGHTYMVTQSRATYVVGDELFDTIRSIEYYKGGGGSTREEMYIKKEGNVEYLAYWYGPTDGWNVQKNENVDSFSGCLNFRKYNYSEFTYENGKYIGNIPVTEYSNETTITVTLKFNDDGYVTYIAMENEEEGLSEFRESAIYNYGTTTYNFPAAAKKAVEDYKAANN